MIRPPDMYRAADHAAKQRSEQEKTDFLLAHCSAWLMKRATSPEEKSEHQANLMFWLRRYQDGGNA